MERKSNNITKIDNYILFSKSYLRSRIYQLNGMRYKHSKVIKFEETFDYKFFSRKRYNLFLARKVEFYYQDVSTKNVKSLCYFIKNSKRIESISFIEMKFIDKFSKLKIIKMLSSSRNLSSLIIRDFTLITDKQILNLLGKVIKKLKNVNSLDLGMYGMARIMNSTLNIYKKLKTLRSISLDLSKISLLFENGHDQIRKILDKLNLVSFKLHLKDDTTASAILGYTSSISKMTNLRNLSMNLDFNKDINMITMKKFFSDLEKIENIEDISFSFDHTSFNSDALNYLTNLFSFYVKLEIFRIKLSGTNVDDDGLSSFFDKILMIEGMKIIDIDLSEIPLKDNCMIKLGKTIAKLQYVEEISICLADNTSFTDKSLLSLCQGLEKMQPSSVSLNLNHCIRISDNGISTLINTLKKNPRIRILELNMSKNPKVNSNTIDVLKNFVLSQLNLQSLKLDLECCQKVNDEDLESLFKALSKSKKLSKLNIHLGSVTNFSSKAMSAFLYSVGSLKYLSEINLEQTTSHCTYSEIQAFNVSYTRSRNVLLTRDREKNQIFSIGNI